MLLIKSQFDEIDATKVSNCKEDVEEVSVEQESNENIPSSLPVQTNEFIIFHDLIFYRPIEEPVVEQVTESVTEPVEQVIEAVQEEEKPQEEKPQEEVAEETPVENQEAPKEECSETAAVEEKQPEEEGKKEKKPRKFYHGRNGDHKGNVKS